MNKHEENTQVLNLVQAMLGSITPNFRVVSLECNPNAVRLYFLLEHESSEDREEIDEIIFEFEALQSSRIDVELVVCVDTRALDELEILGRMVYARKETA
jgi:hypothetical protein